MEEKKIKSEKYPEIVELINSTLPEDEVNHWLVLTKTKKGNFAIMGQAAPEQAVVMVAKFLRHSGIKEMFAAMSDESPEE